MRLLIIGLSIVILHGAVTSAVAGPMFMGLGDLPGGIFASSAQGISGDGSVVVGYGHTDIGTEAFRWENGVMTGLGHIDPADSVSEATAASFDGSVIVGFSRGRSRTEAFRWENGTMVGIGDVPGDPFKGSAQAVSSNGSVVVGWGRSGSDTEAFRWEAGVMTVLSDTSDLFSSFATGVTAGGSAVVGVTADSVLSQASRWKNGEVTTLFEGSAYAISSDGTVVVGSNADSEPVRWQDGIVLSLGLLPDTNSGIARAMSADGSIVVGNVHNINAIAFLWDSASGIRSLESVSTDEFGLDLVGWTLEVANGVSDDGLSIVGYSTDPSARPDAWIAMIPEPSTGLLLGFGLMALAAGRRRR